MCKEYCGDRGFLWRSVGLPEVVGGETLKQYGIAYTSNGSPNGTIVSWNSTIWNNLFDALEGCEMDGWRGYVCEYPSGYRPEGGWRTVKVEEEK